MEKFLQLKTKDMAFVQFIFEGYDGICSISTIDSRAGLIRIDLMPGFEQTVLKVLENLNIEFIEVSY